eukprot:3426264-Rhodomonas_salina.1
MMQSGMQSGMQSAGSTGFLPPIPSKSKTLKPTAALSQSSSSLRQSLRQDSLTIGNSGKFGFHIGDRVKKKGLNAVSNTIVEIQNATSRRLLQQYYQTQPGVPVDWRNGMDMRTLYPAQDPNYLASRPSNTYETTSHTLRPCYEGAIVENRREGALPPSFNLHHMMLSDEGHGL